MISRRRRRRRQRRRDAILIGKEVPLILSLLSKTHTLQMKIFRPSRDLEEPSREWCLDL